MKLLQNLTWSGDKIPYTKVLLPLNVPEKCSVGERRFGDRLVLSKPLLVSMACSLSILHVVAQVRR